MPRPRALLLHRCPRCAADIGIPCPSPGGCKARREAAGLMPRKPGKPGRSGTTGAERRRRKKGER